MDNFYQDNALLCEQSRLLQQEYLNLKNIMIQCEKILENLNRNTDRLRIKSSAGTFGNMATKLLNSSSLDTGNHQGSVATFKFSKLFSMLLNNARASGGNVNAGVPYLVGERGAEMFVPHSSGNIVANHGLAKQTPINITMNIATPDVSGFVKSRSQIMSEIAQVIRRG